MREYTKPEITVIGFKAQDIITASNVVAKDQLGNYFATKKVSKYGLINF